jgi:dTDP-glucose pyrophosphorylase
VGGKFGEKPERIFQPQRALFLQDGSPANSAKELKPSPRGELEITDPNRRYLSRRFTP